MKKLLLLLVIGGLIFTTSSCKKEEDTSCPEPEVWGVGTWKLTDYTDANGNSYADPNDPSDQCLLAQSEIELNDSFNGLYVKFGNYDPNSGSCSVDNYQVGSWAENIDNKKLYISLSFPDGSTYLLDCVYIEKDKFYWDYHGDGSLRVIYERNE